MQKLLTTSAKVVILLMVYFSFLFVCLLPKKLEKSETDLDDEISRNRCANPHYRLGIFYHYTHKQY